jgi:hypothetical protein
MDSLDAEQTSPDVIAAELLLVLHSGIFRAATGARLSHRVCTACGRVTALSAACRLDCTIMEGHTDTLTACLTAIIRLS